MAFRAGPITKEFHLMNHKGRTMFAALVAALALGVVASASASAALPEFVPGTGESFPSVVEYSYAGAHVEYRLLSGNAMECKGVTAKGSVTGAKALSLTVELSDCTTGSGRTKCKTSGAAEGHVIQPVTGTLVYLSKATKQVAVDLKPTVETEILCSTIEIINKGSVPAPITPVNTKASTFDLKISASEKNKQEYTHYENEQGKLTSAFFELNAGAGWELAALNFSEQVTLASSKPLTIDA
jgi:hypothetical protein